MDLPVRIPTDHHRCDRLSARWLGLNWEEHLPWTLAGVRVELAAIEDALPFIRDAYPTIFRAPEGDDRWLADPMTEKKIAFYREADVFVVRDGGRCIGLQIGHPTDWSSYYVRTVALLPEYRGRGIVAQLTARMVEVLRDAGIERVEGDVPPANVANMVAQTRLGYVATGVLNHDRWGAMVRLTRHIAERADDVFRRQFCMGTWPRCPPRVTTGSERSTS
jgi:GNAT superfamily N-acetyltransferase